jgi:hypothetical protein
MGARARFWRLRCFPRVGSSASLPCERTPHVSRRIQSQLLQKAEPEVLRQMALYVAAQNKRISVANDEKTAHATSVDVLLRAAIEQEDFLVKSPVKGAHQLLHRPELLPSPEKAHSYIEDCRLAGAESLIALVLERIISSTSVKPGVRIRHVQLPLITLVGTSLLNYKPEPASSWKEFCRRSVDDCLSRSRTSPHLITRELVVSILDAVKSSGEEDLFTDV